MQNCQLPNCRRLARNRIGSWQQAQIEWLTGPIDGMRVIRSWAAPRR